MRRKAEIVIEVGEMERGKEDKNLVVRRVLESGAASLRDELEV